MPRYYFPSWDGDHFFPDDEGLEYEGVEQARAAAMESLGEMARDSLPRSTREHVLKVRVMETGDQPLIELRLTFERHSFIGRTRQSHAADAFCSKWR